MFGTDRTRPTDRASQRGERRGDASSTEDLTALRPLDNYPQKLDQQARDAARAGFTLDGEHCLPGWEAVVEREKGALASSTRAGLGAVEDHARAIMQALERLEAAEGRATEAQRRLADLEATQQQLADGERELRQAEFAAAQEELAEARQALAQLEPAMDTWPVEVKAVATPVEPDEAKPAAASPTRSRWALVESAMAGLVAAGGFGPTYLGWRATFMPRVFVIPATVATVAFLVWLALTGGRHLKDLVRGERARWRYDRFVMLLIGAAGVMAWAAVTHMRDAGFHSLYQISLGRGFIPDYSYVPWLFWLGLAEFFGMMATSYFCAWKLEGTERPPSLTARLRSSLAARRERLRRQKSGRAREEELTARHRRVDQAKLAVKAARGADVATAKAAIESATAELAAGRSAVDECRGEVAGLVPGLLRAEEDVLVAAQAQAASGNATCCDYHQRLLQHSARLRRGVPQRSHDWWHGREPTPLEGGGPLPAIENGLPQTAEQVHRIAAQAKRRLIELGFLHPHEFLPTALASATPRATAASRNGHRPQLPAITARTEGES
jgi:hypothetical protein